MSDEEYMQHNEDMDEDISGTETIDCNEQILTVQVVENSKMRLSHALDLIENEPVVGKIRVLNPSTSDRVWDIIVNLLSMENTDIADADLSVPHIPPAEEANKTEANGYEIKRYNVTEKGRNILAIKEYISTADDFETYSQDSEEYLSEKYGRSSEDMPFPTRKYAESFAIPKNTECTVNIAIVVENISDEPVREITVRKATPDVLSEVTQSPEATLGNVENEENGFIWRIPELAEKTDAVLTCKSKVIVEGTINEGTGEVSVDYYGKSLDQASVSGLKIQNFKSQTSHSLSTQFYEKEEEPDIYECHIKFVNLSQLCVKLNDIDVSQPDSDEDTDFINLTNENVIVQPELPWISDSWEIFARDYPKLEESWDFDVLWKPEYLTRSQITIEEIDLQVADIRASLKYDVQQLPSFKVRTFNLTIEIVNEGSAPINMIKLIDRMQESFIPPEFKDISVVVASNELDMSLASEVLEYSIEDDMGADEGAGKSLTVLFSDLESMGGQLNPGDIMQISYPIRSDKPAANTTYTSNHILSANTLPAIEPIEIEVEQIEIPVIHERRKYKVGKDISALEDAGSYLITVFLENMGNVNMADIALVDKVPAQFAYSSFNNPIGENQPIISEDPENPDASILKWPIKEVYATQQVGEMAGDGDAEEGLPLDIGEGGSPGSVVEITYVLRGEGDYRPSMIQSTGYPFLTTYTEADEDKGDQDNGTLMNQEMDQPEHAEDEAESAQNEDQEGGQDDLEMESIQKEEGLIQQPDEQSDASLESDTTNEEYNADNEYDKDDEYGEDETAEKEKSSVLDDSAASTETPDSPETPELTETPSPEALPSPPSLASTTPTPAPESPSEGKDLELEDSPEEDELESSIDELFGEEDNEEKKDGETDEQNPSSNDDYVF